MMAMGTTTLHLSFPLRKPCPARGSGAEGVAQPAEGSVYPTPTHTLTSAHVHHHVRHAAKGWRPGTSCGWWHHPRGMLRVSACCEKQLACTSSTSRAETLSAKVPHSSRGGTLPPLLACEPRMPLPPPLWKAMHLHRHSAASSVMWEQSSKVLFLLTSTNSTPSSTSQQRRRPVY
jgi:hypothetical protein